MSRFQDQVIIQTVKKIEGELRDTKEWADIIQLRCRKTKLSPTAQAKYNQVLNSEFTTIIEFPGTVELSMSQNRLRFPNGKTYEPIEPPKFMGDNVKRTRIAVEEVEEEGGA